MDYPCDKFGDCSFSRFGSVVPVWSSIFNRFSIINAVKSKVRNFSTFLHVLASPGYAPRTIAVNVTWIER